MRARVCTGAVFLFVLSWSAEPVLGQNHFLHFDGNSDHVDLGVVPIAGLSELTIEVWRYNDSNATNAGYAYRQSQSANHQLSITVTDDGLLRVVLANGAFTDVQTATGEVPHDTWHHLAVVFDGAGATDADRLKAYLDGVQLTFVSFSQPVPSTVSASLGSTSAYMGAETPPNSRYIGYMDEYRIWSVARTQGEIQANMDIPLVGNEAGLLAYYDFEQGNCGLNNAGLTTLIDRSPNGQDGTLMSFALDTCTSNWVCDGPPCNAPGFSVPVELQSFSVD